MVEGRFGQYRMGAVSFAVVLVITAVLHPGLSQGPLRATLTVEPPGLNIYAGEMVSLQCRVWGGPSGNWTHHWYRCTPHTDALHGAYGEKYTIAVADVTDRGLYWCRAEREREPPLSLLSNAVNLTISELPLARLTVRPSSRQHFWLERMSLQCEVEEGNSTGWTLKHLTNSTVNSGCLPVGGSMKGACEISRLSSGNSGLYWCESEQGDCRTSAVNITVVYGPVIIQVPTQAVAEGDSVTLRCLYWQQSANTTAFYRDGVVILTHNSADMTIRNVTRADQGLYKCAVSNATESPESWLSIRGDLTSQSISPTELLSSSTSPMDGDLTSQSISPTELLSSSTSPTEASLAGSWLTVLVPCCILGVLLFLALGLLAHLHRCHSGAPEEEAPQTKPDVTEIQWDVPWMEMEATLLGKSQDQGD